MQRRRGAASAPAPDTTVPTALVSPASGSPINGSKQIQITFSESMKKTSLVIGGSLQAEADAGTWSTASSSDDRITIAPLTAWAGGGAKTLTIDATDLAGNPLSRLTMTYSFDFAAPTSLVSSSSATIDKYGQIIITFSETMDTNSLVLTGSMASQHDGGVWSTTTNTNDTLTIGPATAWTGGSGRTLTINVTDLAGNAVPAVNLSYFVDTSLVSAAVSPANGSSLATNEAIVVTFSKAMNTATLVTGGTLAAASGAPAWSTTTLTDDTLTISPAATWSVGGAKTLTIDASDTLGNPLTTLNLTYDAGIIFVTTTGNDSDSGQKSAPLKTITAALAKTGFPEVHAQGGTFNETVTMPDGKTLKGSYDTNWTAADVVSTATRIVGASSSGSLIIQNNTQVVTVATVRVDGVTATVPSESSYAVRVLNAAASVNLQSLEIFAGNGANGSNSTDGIDASQTYAGAGNPGGDASQFATTCNDTSFGTGGAGGTGSGLNAGGSGGNGGTMDTACPGGLSNNYDATAGSPGSIGLGNGGSGGLGGGVCLAGQRGSDGGSGFPGSSGAGGSGGSISSGLWVPASGTNGGVGANGRGGGGGGGSGGCDIGTDSYGAGGGGGGAGGARSSAGGTGGGGGGASFGVFVHNSASYVTVSNTNITRGIGGTGAYGGRGGNGQPGGIGGTGGLASGDSAAGGDGGFGGRGGESGGGGGGAGGSVYGIYKSGTTTGVTAGTVNYQGGTAGSGGAGGSRYTFGNAGQSGFAGSLLATN